MLKKIAVLILTPLLLIPLISCNGANSTRYYGSIEIVFNAKDNTITCSDQILNIGLKNGVNKAIPIYKSNDCTIYLVNDNTLLIATADGQLSASKNLNYIKTTKEEEVKK